MPRDPAASEPMQVRSAGAAETVTGSCHHLRTPEGELLVDCGAFQGPSSLEARNREPFPFDPARLDAVLLTHAHLDHVGRLPKLVADGFTGPVLASAASREVAEVILRDAAKLAREDYERAQAKARRKGRDVEGVPPPPYDDADVDRALAAFRTVPWDEPVTAAGVRVTFHPAGHVLGSAWLELDDGAGTVAFSGDLGNSESILHPAPQGPRGARALVMETTYADRRHRARRATRDELCEVLRSAASGGGRVLIPTFALERTQVVLYEIGRLQRAGEVPTVPVYLDAPMGAKMTDLYRRFDAQYRPEVRKAATGGDPFSPPDYAATFTPEESKALNDAEGPMIIVAGSGMMTGGRILHHLRHYLDRTNTQVIVVGYQAHGTLGRALIGGARQVRIHGHDVDVRATMHTIGGLSAHADRDDLVAWAAGAPDADLHLVHGEPEVMATFARNARARGRRAAPLKEGTPVSL